MTVPDAVLVAAGAAVGAPLRFLLDRAIQRRVSGAFPWGTFTVNVAGCFVLGVVAAGGSHTAALFVGVGLCGAFTTFSTFGHETERLLASGSRQVAAANVVGSASAGLVAAAAGWWIG